MIATNTAKTTIRRFALSAFIACACALALGVAPAFADTIPDLTSDAEAMPYNGVPIPVVVTLDQPTTREDAMRTISEYRQEALDQGLVELPEGMTADQYVHGFTWNQDLERIAVQRAIEHAIAEDLAHERPNGVWWGYTKSNEVRSSTESLAGGGIPKRLSYNLEYIEKYRAFSGLKLGLNLWHSEIVSYKSNKEKGTHYTYGHYWSMVNPEYTSFGCACVAVIGGEWMTCTLEAGRGDQEASDVSVGYVGAYDATVYANDNECFTVDLHPYCQSGTLQVGESSNISVMASSSFTGNDTWSLDPTRIAYTSTDPTVLKVDADGTVTGLSKGYAQVIVQVGEEMTSVAVPVTDEKSAFRLYNPYSGEHFYTLKAEENANLVAEGWYPEGLGWISSSDESIPVYRLYNSYAGEHHYTMSASERDSLVAQGWTYEGVGWNSDPKKGQVLYREYNPNEFSCNHNYTTDKSEHDGLIELGWRDEGTAWYGIDPGALSGDSSELTAG